MEAPTPIVTQRNREHSSRKNLLAGDASVRRFFPADDPEMQGEPIEASFPRQAQILRPAFSPDMSSIERERAWPRSPLPSPISTNTLPLNSHHNTTGCDQPPTRSRSHSIGSMSLDSHTGSVSGHIQTKPKELFEFIREVGEGTFGKVFKAQDTSTGRFVALKRIRMEGERDGFPVTAMRETKLLQSLQHPNVVKLHVMMVTKSGPVQSVAERY